MLHSFIKQIGVFLSFNIVLVDAIGIELGLAGVLHHSDLAPGV